MIEDYRIKFNTFRMSGTGTYTINRRGRSVEVQKGCSFCNTENHGEIEEKEWDRLVLLEVEKENKINLLNQIIKYCRINCLWLKEHQLQHYALSCLANHAYEYWEDFKI